MINNVFEVRQQCIRNVRRPLALSTFKHVDELKKVQILHFVLKQKKENTVHAPTRQLRSFV